VCQDAVQEKMRALKQGRSAVVERGHTVILGWTEETVTIVREIALANASTGGGVVAILSDRRKSALEAELASALKRRDLHGTRVVFRTGSRLRAADLLKVATQTARAIIVVSDGRLPPHSADAEVLQVVLNLATLRLRHANVVVEVRVSDNEVLLHLVSQGSVATVPSHDLCGALMLQFARQPGLARVYSSVLGFHGSEFYVAPWPQLEGTAFRDLAPRFPDAIPVGIVSADGACDLNPRPERVLVFGDKLVVIAEDDDSYAPQLPQEGGSGSAGGAGAPKAAAKLNGSGSLSSYPPDASCFVPLGAHAAPAPERVLFAGWRRDMPSMMQLLDRLVAPGSELHVACALPVASRLDEIAEAGVSLDALRNLTVVHHVANTAVRRQLEALPLDACSSMIIASDAAAAEDVIHSDSHALATLLLVRGIQAARRRRATTAAAAAAGSASSTDLAALAAEPSGRLSASAAAGAAVSADDIQAALQAEAPPAEEDDAAAASAAQAGAAAVGARPGTAGHGVALRFSGDVMSSAANLPIVCEILDPRTQRTVTESTPMGLVSEFMQSNDLVSKILAMVAEDPLCKTVLDQLLGGTGTQFAVVAAEEYVSPRAEVSFAELAAHCSAVRRCVLCGFIEPHAAKRSAAKVLPACVLNPARKNARRAWGGYSLVVIATDLRLVASSGATQSRAALNKWEEMEK
jgi:hypothetical protein